MLWPAILLLLLASPAGSDPRVALAPAFTGTIVSTYPDGRTAKLWLDEDGRYSAEGRRHDASRGHWTLRDGKLCLTQARPIPFPFAYCTPVPAAAGASAWRSKAVTGETIIVRLTPGR